jgi:hypothetical protein
MNIEAKKFSDQVMERNETYFKSSRIKKTPLVETLPVHPTIGPSVNQSINQQPVIQYTVPIYQ